MLCAVKPAPHAERRFCFELSTATDRYLLQAETEAELAEWLAVIANAKQRALTAHADADALAEHVQRQLDTSVSDVALNVPPTESTVSRAVVGLRSAVTGGGGAGGGGGVGGSLAPVVPVVFRSTEYHKKNMELHTAFARSVPTTEICFEALHCSLQPQGEVAVRGRLFATHVGCYFASNVLGSLRTLALPWNEVTRVEVARQSVVVTLTLTMEGPPPAQHYTIWYTSMSGDYVARAIEGLWANARAADPAPPMELYDRLYRQMEVAKAAGTGSGGGAAVAATASGQPAEADDGEGTAGDASSVTSDPDEAAAAEFDESLESNVSAGPLIDPEVTKSSLPFEWSGDVYCDLVLPVAIDRLFAMLFQDGSPTSAAIMRRTGRTEVTADPWSQPGVIGATKRIAFKARLAAPVAGLPSTPTQCYETCTLVRHDPGDCYIVDHIVVMPKAPHGESFAVQNRIGLAAAGEGAARLHISMTPVIKRNLFMLTGMYKLQVTRTFTAQVRGVVSVLRAEIRSRRATLPALRTATSAGSLSPASSAALPSKVDHDDEAAKAKATAAAAAAAAHEPAAVSPAAAWVYTLLAVLALALLASVSGNVYLARASAEARAAAAAAAKPAAARPVNGWCGDDLLRGGWTAGEWPLLNGALARTVPSFAAFRKAVPADWTTMAAAAGDHGANTTGGPWVTLTPSTLTALASVDDLGASFLYACHRVEQARVAALETAFVGWLAREIEACLVEEQRLPSHAAADNSLLCLAYQRDFLHLWRTSLPELPLVP